MKNEGSVQGRRGGESGKLTEGKKNVSNLFNNKGGRLFEMQEVREGDIGVISKRKMEGRVELTLRRKGKALFFALEGRKTVSRTREEAKRIQLGGGGGGQKSPWSDHSGRGKPFLAIGKGGEGEFS